MATATCPAIACTRFSTSGLKYATLRWNTISTPITSSATSRGATMQERCSREPVAERTQRGSWCRSSISTDWRFSSTQPARPFAHPQRDGSRIVHRLACQVAVTGAVVKQVVIRLQQHDRALFRADRIVQQCQGAVQRAVQVEAG